MGTLTRLVLPLAVLVILFSGVPFIPVDMGQSGLAALADSGSFSSVTAGSSLSSPLNTDLLNANSVGGIFDLGYRPSVQTTAGTNLTNTVGQTATQGSLTGTGGTVTSGVNTGVLPGGSLTTQTGLSSGITNVGSGLGVGSALVGGSVQVLIPFTPPINPLTSVPPVQNPPVQTNTTGVTGGPIVATECNDGKDNDGDGRVDFADLDCGYSSTEKGTPVDNDTGVRSTVGTTGSGAAPTAAGTIVGYIPKSAVVNVSGEVNTNNGSGVSGFVNASKVLIALPSNSKASDYIPVTVTNPNLRYSDSAVKQRAPTAINAGTLVTINATDLLTTIIKGSGSANTGAIQTSGGSVVLPPVERKSLIQIAVDNAVQTVFNLFGGGPSKSTNPSPEVSVMCPNTKVTKSTSQDVEVSGTKTIVVTRGKGDGECRDAVTTCEKTENNFSTRSYTINTCTTKCSNDQTPRETAAQFIDRIQAAQDQLDSDLDAELCAKAKESAPAPDVSATCASVKCTADGVVCPACGESTKVTADCSGHSTSQYAQSGDAKNSSVVRITVSTKAKIPVTTEAIAGCGYKAPADNGTTPAGGGSGNGGSAGGSSGGGGGALVPEEAVPTPPPALWQKIISALTPGKYTLITAPQPTTSQPTPKKICNTLGGTDTNPTGSDGAPVSLINYICPADAQCADGSACRAYRTAGGSNGCGCLPSQQKPASGSTSGGTEGGNPPTPTTPTTGGTPTTGVCKVKGIVAGSGVLTVADLESQATEQVGLASQGLLPDETPASILILYRDKIVCENTGNICGADKCAPRLEIENGKAVASCSCGTATPAPAGTDGGTPAPTPATPAAPLPGSNPPPPVSKPPTSSAPSAPIQPAPPKVIACAPAVSTLNSIAYNVFPEPVYDFLVNIFAAQNINKPALKCVEGGTCSNGKTCSVADNCSCGTQPSTTPAPTVTKIDPKKTCEAWSEAENIKRADAEAKAAADAEALGLKAPQTCSSDDPWAPCHFYSVKADEIKAKSEKCSGLICSANSCHLNAKATGCSCDPADAYPVPAPAQKPAPTVTSSALTKGQSCGPTPAPGAQAGSACPVNPNCPSGTACLLKDGKCGCYERATPAPASVPLKKGDICYTPPAGAQVGSACPAVSNCPAGTSCLLKAGTCGCYELAPPPVTTSGTSCQCRILKYGRPGCGNCSALASKLNSLNVPYEEHNIDSEGDPQYSTTADNGQSCGVLPWTIVDCSMCGGTRTRDCGSSDSVAAQIKQMSGR